MGRLRKADAAAEEAQLASAPAPTRDWKPFVDKLTRDEERRAVILEELAGLDEMERSYRRYMVRGNAGAGALLIKIKKQRAELLRLETPDEEPQFPGEVDLVDWTPATPPKAKP